MENVTKKQKVESNAKIMFATRTAVTRRWTKIMDARWKLQDKKMQVTKTVVWKTAIYYSGKS